MTSVTDSHGSNVKAQHLVHDEPIQPQPAPIIKVGLWGWLRANLFNGPVNSLITLILLYVVARGGLSVFSWGIMDANWLGEGSAACTSEGACWPFITNRFSQLIFGFYPEAERWRVGVAFVIWVCCFAWVMVPRLRWKKLGLVILILVMPMVNLWLLRGGVGGLVGVPTRMWGGIVLTLAIATVAMLNALPMGILLALGRQSRMALVRGFCVVFIEFWRGVPLVTVLFTAATIFPLFIPVEGETDKLLRAMLGISIFWSAYFAEVIRAGLQAIPNGQIEAGKSLCLGYWARNILIVLPQAMKLVIPGLVGVVILLLRETSLVVIIGLFDFLGVIKTGLTDPEWIAYAAEGYVFAALVYWTLCFLISRYGMWLERRVDTGRH